MSSSPYTPLAYRIAFASLQGMGVDLARKLLDVVGSEERFFAMREKELRSLTRGRSKIYSDDYRRDCLGRAVREEAFVREHGIGATYFTDGAYPHRLLEAPDAPAMIYTLGQCNLESGHVISIVGTRHATQYGTRWCDTMIGELAQRLPDLVVVSGLAYGIDIAARSPQRCHRYRQAGRDAIDRLHEPGSSPEEQFSGPQPHCGGVERLHGHRRVGRIGWRPGHRFAGHELQSRRDGCAWPLR